MNELKIFENKEFGSVRTLEIDGKPYFCGSDVAKALGYAKPQNAISTHCKGAVKQGIGVQTGVKSDGTPSIQNVEMLFIPEGDIYRLIVKSKLPTAEKFESWVFDEVIPSIRKNGGYISNTDLFVDTYFDEMPEEQKNVLRGLLTNIEEKQKKIKGLQAENDLLAQKTLEWADRPIINALVRAYAHSIDDDFAGAWREFKKELLYRYGINLNARKTNHLNNSGNKSKKTLDFINDEELPQAISTAVAMCRDKNIDISEIIQKKAS